jgi:hypothetical protein
MSDDHIPSLESTYNSALAILASAIVSIKEKCAEYHETLYMPIDDQIKVLDYLVIATDATNILRPTIIALIALGKTEYKERLNWLVSILKFMNSTEETIKGMPS